MDTEKSPAKGLNASEIPIALVLPGKANGQTKWWWLTALCVIVSAGLFYYSQQTAGEPIVIEFLDGYGIKPEDRLKHHGIDAAASSGLSLVHFDKIESNSQIGSRLPIR